MSLALLDGLVTSAIISHDRTQSNRVCCFQALDSVFPRGLFSEYLEIRTAVVVHFMGLWD